MTQVGSFNVVAIASLKRGMESFVHRELSRMSANGQHITLLPTKVGRGLYAPDAGWNVLTGSRWKAPGGHLRLLFTRPRLYQELLKEAVRYRVLAEFLLAGAHATELAHNQIVYATFADRKLFVGYFLKRFLGLPLAVTIHAYELYDNPRPEFFPRALAACDHISTVTEFNREQLSERYGVDPTRVSVTRISVNLDEFKPKDTLAVLIVGFFNERKGHGDLFEAVRRLADPNVEVWVVGGEGAEEYLDVPALAEAKGVTHQVAFFGPLRGAALRALYQRCDVFCLPSRTTSRGVKEGFPTVIAEAMAFGKPVISTNHSEIPRILSNVIVEEGDVDGLADAIRLLRDDPALRKRLGAENRQHAERLFDLSNVDNTVRALSRLADGSADPPHPVDRAYVPASENRRAN